ncbi:MAG: hypothetical protein GQF41_4098 [Candidatus Rifleibacterium amylolyticum]|nr:MAG: hypothetical protein GQF41_4098 [Candidatus Rifleibacterium amylolyticum]
MRLSSSRDAAKLRWWFKLRYNVSEVWYSDKLRKVKIE